MLFNNLKNTLQNREMVKTIDAAVNMIKAAAESAEAFQALKVDQKEGMAMMEVVEDFLHDRGRLLYGGFAINAALPDSAKFYDPEKEIPDYDFLTPDPIADVVELMNRFKEKGYSEVEPSIGIHEGTYKVYVNFQPVADITHCDLELYENLWKESLRVGKVRICPVNYLRMNMYLELSRPAGDVSRWPKVYKRLLIFNKHFPIVGDCDATPSALNAGRNAARSLDLDTLSGKIREKTLDHVVSRDEVVMGFSEALWVYKHIHERGMTRKKSLVRRAIQTGDPLVIFLSKDAKESAEELSAKFGNTSVVKSNSYGELLPERYFVNLNGVPIAVAVQTVSCHAYIEVPYKSKTLNVASMDTLINFYFAFYYGNTKSVDLGAHILCLCQMYIDRLAELRDPKYSGPVDFPIFPVKCHGYQPGLPELKRLQRKRSKEERARIKAVEDIRRESAKQTRKVKSAPVHRTRKSKSSKSSKSK